MHNELGMIRLHELLGEKCLKYIKVPKVEECAFGTVDFKVIHERLLSTK